MFRSFRLAGFAQLQEVALDFAEDAPSLIVGPNEAGKSHLLTALIGTLFGVTPAETDACIPWNGEPSMCASLDFEANGERISLVRHFLDERVEVVVGGETIYSGRGRTFGRGIAEDQRYRELLAGWLGFSEMEIFRDLVFVEQDQLGDGRLGKQAPEIKRLITGSHEASYETALADLTDDLDRLKKLPRRRNDREIEQLLATQADLMRRIEIAEQSEAAVIDLRESELQTRDQLAALRQRRATLAELLEAHSQLTTLDARLDNETEAYERATHLWEQANSSAERRAALTGEITRLQVPNAPNLETLRRTRFELEAAAETVRRLGAERDASPPQRLPPEMPARPRRQPNGIVMLTAFLVALLSLILAFSVNPLALAGLVIAIAMATAAVVFAPVVPVGGASRREIERQHAEQERMRRSGELHRAETRLAQLKAHCQAWLAPAGEPDLASLIARLEQHQAALIKLETMPVASAEEIARLQAEQRDCMRQMAITQHRIEQLQSERPELLTLTAEMVARHRQEIERLDEQARELDQVQRTNEIRRGVLNQTAVDDAAALRVALAENAAELARKQQLAEALELAIDTLRDCVGAFQENALDPVAGEAGRLLGLITGGRHRSVRLDQATMEPTVGNDIPVAALSRGTRDQLYLAIRLALVDALSGGLKLPLIVDDPCVHFDRERLAATAHLLGEIARERQVIILSKDDTFTRWFTPALRLPASAAVVPNGVSD